MMSAAAAEPEEREEALVEWITAALVPVKVGGVRVGEKVEISEANVLEVGGKMGEVVAGAS